MSFPSLPGEDGAKKDLQHRSEVLWTVGEQEPQLTWQRQDPLAIGHVGQNAVCWRRRPI
jgi:hypothetical protein